MKNFIKNSFIFLCICASILYAYCVFCEWFFNQDKFLPSNSRRYWAMKQSKGVFDYAVLGSSRAEGAFDMKMLDSLTGLKGINIGADGSGYVDNYLVFNKFLNNKNKIKYLFLQTDVYSLDPTRSFSNAFHVYNFLPYWKNPVFKEALCHYLDSTDIFLFTNLPWLRFYKYNKFYSPLQIIEIMKTKSQVSKRIDQNIKSSMIVPTKTKTDSTVFFKPENSRKIFVDSFDLNYLGKIFDLAEKKGIKVICFTAPDFWYQKKIFSNYQPVDSSLINFIDKRNLLHLPKDNKIGENIYLFKDPGHLNKFGRYAFTYSFSSSLKDYLQKAD